jgi:hypothetical protein
MSGAAVIIRRQRRAMRQFREAGAMSAKQAKTFGEVGARQSRSVNWLIRAGVLVEVSDGRFYLDEQAARRYEQRRLQRVMIALIATAVFVLVLLLCSAGR